MTEDSIKYPKAVVFDLDYTLWPCWCDTHIIPPYKKTRKEGDSIIDRNGYVLTLYPDVKPIFEHLQEHNVQIFTASRTVTPKRAIKLLKLYELESSIVHSEWGSFSKKNHLSRISEKFDIPLEEMILFDDEYRNNDVKSIGCGFGYLPNEELTWNEFYKGIKSWSDHYHGENNLKQNNVKTNNNYY
ncbi:unnamed protein product [Ambrosiozyma monospora]|uniref:Unnamed protein product n=1 Tax=Ambrosiozyma monospora TaxID=43982 RepID=A0A9W6YZV4_AMBMO|nr:unnamed protein product [Ambrosiozyma monospora]